MCIWGFRLRVQDLEFKGSGSKDIRSTKLAQKPKRGPIKTSVL